METIWLQRSSEDVPWGFRLQGGSEFNLPMAVQRVTPGSVASHGLSPGDVILKIGNVNASNLSHVEGQELIRKATNILQLTIRKGGAVPIPTSSPYTPITTDPFSYNIPQTYQQQNYQTPTFQVGHGRTSAAQSQEYDRYGSPYTTSPAPPSYDSVYRDVPQQRYAPQPQQQRSAPFSPQTQRFVPQQQTSTYSQQPASRGFQPSSQGPFSPGSSRAFPASSYDCYNRDPWNEPVAKVAPGVTDFMQPSQPQRPPVNDQFGRYDEYGRQDTRQNVYAPQDPHGRQDNFGRQDSFGRHDVYGRPERQDAYGRQDSLGRHDPYGQTSFGRQDSFGRGDNYGMVDSYGRANTGSLGRQQSFGSPPGRYNATTEADYSSFSNTLPRRYGQPPAQTDFGISLYDKPTFQGTPQISTSSVTFTPSSTAPYKDHSNIKSSYDDTVYKPFGSGGQSVSRPIAEDYQNPTPVSRPFSQDNVSKFQSPSDGLNYFSSNQPQPVKAEPVPSSPLITVEPPPAPDPFSQPPPIPEAREEPSVPEPPPAPAIPAPPPPPPPPPAPPLPTSGPAPGAWRQKKAEQEGQQAIPSSRNGVDSGNKEGGQGKLPDGLLAAMNKPGQKPFSYIAGADLKQQLQGMKERRRQALQEAAKTKVTKAPVAQAPELHAPVSARPAPATIQSTKNPSCPPLPSSALDRVQAKYNSPMQVYSNETIKEAFAAQAGGASQGMQERPRKDESEVAKFIRESETGGKPSVSGGAEDNDFRGALRKREKDPEFRHNAEDDEMRFSGLNRGTGIPSKSFSRLQKLTVNDQESQSQNKQFLSPNGAENEDGGVGNYDETSIRYKGKYIPSPAFRVLQNWAELDPLEVSTDPSETCPDRRDKEDVQNPDEVPDERRYKGSNIPSRVFRTLQMAVGDEQGSDKETSSATAPSTNQDAPSGPRGIRVVHKSNPSAGATDF